MSDISQAIGEQDAALAEAISKCATSDEVKGVMRDFQRNIQVNGKPMFVADRYDPSILLPNPEVEPGTNPRGFAKTIVINGEKHILEAPTEAGLLAAENQLLQSVLATPAAAKTEVARDATTGRFVQAEEVDAAEVQRRADLDRQFRTGLISTENYLSQSGLIERYLAAQGIDVDELKSASAEKAEAKFIGSWEQATEAFRARHANDWEGGEENTARMAQIIADNDLADSADKLDAMERAYQHLKNNDLVAENPETAYQREIAAASSSAEIHAITNRYFGGGKSSALFGR